MFAVDGGKETEAIRLLRSQVYHQNDSETDYFKVKTYIRLL